MIYVYDFLTGNNKLETSLAIPLPSKLQIDNFYPRFATHSLTYDTRTVRAYHLLIYLTMSIQTIILEYRYRLFDYTDFAT